MRHSRLIAASIPVFVIVASGFALAATHIDGKLPIYPNAVPRGFTWNTPKIDQALKAGFGVFADSSDSVATVAGWYQGNLPKACVRSASPTAVRYECPAGVVGIRIEHGKTMLVILPK